MKLTLTPSDTTTQHAANAMTPMVTVEIPYDDLPVWDVVYCLVRPVLLAAGYAEKSIDDVLGER